MTDRLLQTMVPDTTVGIAVVASDGVTFTATWADRENSVPAERRVIARALRYLADMVEAEDERLAEP